VDGPLVTLDDMTSYKHMLESTNGHLSDIDPMGHIRHILKSLNMGLVTRVADNILFRLEKKTAS
jgi:hypothetical protein